ncbi:MAG: glycosyltransferase family 4 protein [Candidatus Methylomirabilota bacterium]
MRVVMVSDVSPLHIEGGGERVLWEQASRLAGRGHQVRILSRAPAGPVPAPTERQGVSIYHFPVSHLTSPGFFVASIIGARRALAAMLAEGRADVLHLYQPLSGFGVSGLCRSRGLPMLYTFLSPAPLEYASRVGMTGHHRAGAFGRLIRTLYQRLERTVLERADRIHVLSDFSASQLQDLYKITDSRVVKIPGAVDADRFSPALDRLQVRNDLGYPARRPLLLTVRNLEARMGLDTLIRAMALLRRQIPDVLLLIGGTGALCAPLAALVGTLDLGEHVRFLGYIPDTTLPRYYQAADAFVLPTRELEGFGLITVEALACGTPVLGTLVGATPEILTPLDASWLFPEATPEGMASRLTEFLTELARDPAMAGRLQRRCREFVMARYRWDLCIPRLEALLTDLAKPKPAGTA